LQCEKERLVKIRDSLFDEKKAAFSGEIEPEEEPIDYPHITATSASPTDLDKGTETEDTEQNDMTRRAKGQTSFSPCDRKC